MKRRNKVFQIDPISRTPIYEQLIGQIEKFIMSGVLRSGDQLPSVRSLSISLSVNPNTIQKAYNELDIKKIITSVQGKGCFISENALDIIYASRASNLGELQKTLTEYALAGISKQDILDMVERAYENTEN